MGDAEDDFHFSSQEFDYHETSLDVQIFKLEPHLICAKFIKVLLIGKRQRQ